MIDEIYLKKFNVDDYIDEEDKRENVIKNICRRGKKSCLKILWLYQQLTEFKDGGFVSQEDFMEKFESGLLDDRDDFFDWYAAKKGFNSWDKKLEILLGISL